MKVVTQNYIGTTEEWKTANPVLYNAVWGFEKTGPDGQGPVLAKLGNGKDRWNNLKYFDIDNIKGLNEKIQAAVNLEAQAREQRDSELERAISSETQARAAADRLLEQGIETEARARENMEAGLRELTEAVAVEAWTRQQQDSELEQAIAGEAKARESANDLLEEKLDELAPLNGDLNGLLETIIEETRTRQQRDNELEQAIAAEAEVRESADENLRGMINTATADYRRTASASIIPNAQQTTRIASWADVYNTIISEMVNLKIPTGLAFSSPPPTLGSSGKLITGSTYTFTVEILPKGARGMVEWVEAVIEEPFTLEQFDYDDLGLTLSLYIGSQPDINLPYGNQHQLTITARLKNNPEITVTQTWAVEHESKYTL